MINEIGVRTPFAEVHARAYGWTVDVDGYLCGLVAGDMGFEQTDMKLDDLFVNAQVKEDQTARETRGPWPVYEATAAFIDACFARLSNPGS